MSGSSTLDPDNFPEAPDRSLGKGHGTGALGPSDNSDSGSDVAGGPGLTLANDDDLDLGQGTTSDLDSGRGGQGAGPDVGDANLDSDSDAGGTGERAAAGRDSSARDGADIDTDQIQSFPDTPLDDEDIDFLSSLPPEKSTRRGGS